MYSEIPVNGKERKVGQALGNQDVGTGEFREMGFTQKVMSVCWASQDGSLCHESFVRNPFLHVLKGLERLGRRSKKQRNAHLLGHLSLKKFSPVPKWIAGIVLHSHPTTDRSYIQLLPKNRIWDSRTGLRKKSTSQPLFVVTIKQLWSTHGV